MGSDGSTRTKLAVRCCQGAYFALGFVITTVTFAVMFWIVWCYFGIAIVQISDSQRRALVNYSYTTKPQPTPTTPAPRIESSITNTIVKSTSTAAAVNRGTTQAQPAPSISSNPSPSREKDEKNKAVPAPILNGSSEDSSEEEGLYVRRVSSEVGDNNRPDPTDPKDDSSSKERRNSPEKESNRPNIEPTEVRDDNGRSRKPEEPNRSKTITDESKPALRDPVDRVLPPRRDDTLPSRRSDSEPSYEESDYPRRYADDKGRPRPRYSEDRYPKGERRIYPDDDISVEKERVRRPAVDDRYYDRVPVDDRSRAKDDRYTDRYPDDPVRRSDDDRYYRDRDYDDRRKDDGSRTRDSKLRPEDDKYIRRDERYRDDDRYDERYSEEEKYRRRGSVGYSPRAEDEKYRPRDEEKYRDRTIDERDRAYNSRKSSTRDDKEEYVSRTDGIVRDRDFRDSIVSSRKDSDRPLRDDRPIPLSVDDRPIENPRILDRNTKVRDRTYIDDDIVPSRVETPPRIPVPEDRYKSRDDEYKRPTRYDAIDDIIRPTKTRDDDYVSQPSISSSRPRIEERYIDRDEPRRRDGGGYYDEESKRRDEEFRSGTSRRVDGARDEYRTRLPNERRDEVVLDRRSYASEEEDYRRGDSRTRTAYEDDRVRRPYRDDRQDYENPKRVYTEERPSRPTRVDDADYERSRPRGDYDDSRPRYRDRPEDEYRRYDRVDDRYVPREDDKYIPREDDKYIPRDDDRYPRDDRSPSTVRKYPRYPEDDIRTKPREADRLVGRKDELPRPDDRDVRSRPDRFDEIPPRADTRDPYPYSENRKYDDVPPSQGSRSLKDVYESGSSVDSRRRLESSSAKEPLIGPPVTSSAYSKEPSRVYLREKRYQVTESSRNLKDDYYPETRGIERDQLEDLIERPVDIKDVIGTAIRQTDGDRQNKKVFYPVLDPRVSNLTSPDVIRASERRGTTITAKRRRRRTMEYILPK